MTQQERLLHRIEYQGDISSLMSQIAQDYDLGTVRAHRMSEMGYEDLNAAIETDKGTYFAKMFATFRGTDGSQRYVTTMEKAIAAGVSHPRLCPASDGNLHTVKTAEQEIPMVLMEFIDGGTILEQGRKLTIFDKAEIVRQAVLINRIEYKPPFVYDSWSITHLPQEFERKKVGLSANDQEMVKPAVRQLQSVDLSTLPHAFVHGDIRSSNTMKNKEGKLYVIDFAVSNWSPRIVELAVLLSELFFDPDSPAQTRQDFKWMVEEYQKYHKLTSEELRLLPFFVKAAHAMNVLGASYEAFRGNNLGENDEWLTLGRKGIASLS